MLLLLLPCSQPFAFCVCVCVYVFLVLVVILLFTIPDYATFACADLFVLVHARIWVNAFTRVSVSAAKKAFTILHLIQYHYFTFMTCVRRTISHYICCWYYFNCVHIIHVERVPNWEFHCENASVCSTLLLYRIIYTFNVMRLLQTPAAYITRSSKIKKQQQQHQHYLVELNLLINHLLVVAVCLCVWHWLFPSWYPTR